LDRTLISGNSMTELLDLVISVKTRNWRADDPESYAQQAEYRLMREKALSRDKRKCRFCGFAEVSYPEVHHLDDDHFNNSLDNLMTSCPWCHQYHHIGLAGMMGTAELAWMPGVSPRNVHHMMRAMMVCKSWSKAPRTEQEKGIAKLMKNGIESLQAAITNRVTMAKQKFGSSNPIHLADALLKLNAENPDRYNSRDTILEGLVLIPTGHYYRGGRDIMDEVVSSWTAEGSKSGLAGEFHGIPPKTWNSMLSQYLPTLKNRV
jgi:intracellular multiplication protein IcmJ